MTVKHPGSLRELNDRKPGAAPWRLDFLPLEPGGGKAWKFDFAALARRPDATAIHAGGLDQAAFERLVEDRGHRYRGLSLWKCPRIADLTPLETLPNLTHVSIYWNQRATRLWDFGRTPALRGLQFDDFSRLHDLTDLTRAVSLDELVFGNAVWSKAVFETLDPLRPLGRLRHLVFNAKGIVDGRVEPLASLCGLRELSFNTSLFTTRQVAWLRARLPASVRDGTLVPAIGPIHSAFDHDVTIVGKGKRTLRAVTNRKRIDELIAEFETQVEAPRADPAAPPEGPDPV